MSQTMIPLKAPYGTTIRQFADGSHMLMLDTANLVDARKWLAGLAKQAGEMAIAAMKTRIEQEKQARSEVVKAHVYRSKSDMLKEQIGQLEAQLKEIEDSGVELDELQGEIEINPALQPLLGKMNGHEPTQLPPETETHATSSGTTQDQPGLQEIQRQVGPSPKANGQASP